MALLNKLEKRGKIVFAGFLARFLCTEKIAPAEFDHEDVKRLLIIRQHDQMGDMLLAVPAFRGIRKRFPAARISLLAASINTDVMRNNPYIDELITYSGTRYWKNPFGILRFVRNLRSHRFDVVIVLNTVSFSVTSMLLAVVCGARIRIGCSSRTFGHNLTFRYYHMELSLPSFERLESMHESENNLYPLREIGVEETDLTSLIVSTSAEIKECKNLIEVIDPRGGGYAVVHPGAGKKRNIWPSEGFASIVRYLSEKYGINTVAVRGLVDIVSFDRFLSKCPDVPVVLSCPGVGMLAELMRRAVVTICNDTGVMHIAGAAGARCVAVFGPTAPSRWKPVNKSVIAVSSEDGNTGSVTVPDVMSAVESLLPPVRGR